jgi:hypothetical protein
VTIPVCAQSCYYLIATTILSLGRAQGWAQVEELHIALCDSTCELIQACGRVLAERRRQMAASVTPQLLKQMDEQTQELDRKVQEAMNRLT